MSRRSPGISNGPVAEAGYVADIARDGEEGWFRASTEEYDAVVLDLGLPKLDGLSVVRRLREEGSMVPILVLTARGAWLQRVEGIDAGADDYLTKPFEMEESRAPRCFAASRRQACHAADRNRDHLCIDTRRLRVMINGRAVELSPLEFRLLRYLAPITAIASSSQSELVEHVYGLDEPESNTVEALLPRLRRKIGHERDPEPGRGHGYIMRQVRSHELAFHPGARSHSGHHVSIVVTIAVAGGPWSFSSSGRSCVMWSRISICTGPSLLLPLNRSER